MELNWSTFVLEIINFLVLVWILKRFLYRPVLSILDKRREKIEQSMVEAKQQHDDAVALEQQYHERLNTWEHEKLQLRETLQQELQEERKQKLEALKNELDTEREKARVIEQRSQSETQRQYHHKAHEQAARFASKVLTAVASEDVESRLFDLFIKSFDELSEAKQKNIINAYKSASDTITVSSVFTLSTEQKKLLEQKISELVNQPVNVTYTQDKTLLAGLRISIGAWALRINLKDELNGFTELLNEFNQL